MAAGIAPGGGIAPTVTIALYVFARAPRPGEVKTRLCPPLSPEQAAALHAAFVADTLAIALTAPDVEVRLAATAVTDPQVMRLAARAGVPLVPQAQGDLGARMRAAIESALAEGFAAAAILGSDHPTLPPRLLAHALALLGRAPIVLGPAEDGGYWIVGATRLVPAMFADLPWGTARVVRETIVRLRASCVPCALADEWYDIDEPADLTRLRDEAAGAPASRAALARIDAAR